MLHKWKWRPPLIANMLLHFLFFFFFFSFCSTVSDSNLIDNGIQLFKFGSPRRKKDAPNWTTKKTSMYYARMAPTSGCVVWSSWLRINIHGRKVGDTGTMDRESICFSLSRTSAKKSHATWTVLIMVTPIVNSESRTRSCFDFHGDILKWTQENGDSVEISSSFIFSAL